MLCSCNTCYASWSPMKNQSVFLAFRCYRIIPFERGTTDCLMLNVISCLLLCPELLILLYLFPVSGLTDFSVCNTTCLTMPQVIKILKTKLLFHSRSGSCCSKKPMPRSKSGVQKEWDVTTEPVKSSSQKEKREKSRSHYPLEWVELRLDNIKVLSHNFSKQGKSCSSLTAQFLALDQ